MKHVRPFAAHARSIVAKVGLVCTSPATRRATVFVLVAGATLAACSPRSTSHDPSTHSETTSSPSAPASTPEQGEPASTTPDQRATTPPQIATSEPPIETTSPALSSPPLPAAPAASLREVFPGVRADVAHHIVEFDGIVPIDAHNPKSPRVYLEVIACTFDSKEHESLVATHAKASHVHAALLMIGLEPGSPGSWKVDKQSRVITMPPSGAEVRVSLIFNPAANNATEIDPASLVINARTRERASSIEHAGFVFAGSRIVEWQGKSFYDADGVGTLIGLATFGSETVAWRDVFSPEASLAEPVWIADPERLPPAGTPVTVRLRPTRTDAP